MNDSQSRRFRDRSVGPATLISEGCKISGLITGEKVGLEPTKELKGAELTQFAIQDGANNWHWAKAKIDGASVVVWNDEVKDPKHVRFGYQSNPDTINLYNKEGLPASPFTTD